MSDPEAEWEAPSRGLKGKEPHHREADHLSAQVLAHAPHSEYAREFVEHRFRFPLVNYRRRSTLAAIFHIALNLLTAAGGLATAAIAAGGGTSSFWKSVIIAIGLLVGLLAGMNQMLRPGERNLTYARTWLALRTEGWNYVCGLAQYSPKADLNAEAAAREWARFVARVIGAQQEAEGIAEPGGDVVGTSSGGAASS